MPSMARKQDGDNEEALEESIEEPSEAESCEGELRDSDSMDLEEEEEEGEEEEEEEEEEKSSKKRKAVEEERRFKVSSSSKKSKKKKEDSESRFVGDPVPLAEARQRWPERYDQKKRQDESGSRKSKSDGDEADVLKARCHYLQAEVDGCIFNLYDDAYVKGEEGQPDYIGRIVEFFETTDRQPYFAVHWFFKAEDTVIKELSYIHDQKRVFFSDLKDDNPLDCIVSKLKIIQVEPNVDFEARKQNTPLCDFYFDMAYSMSYSTFENLQNVPGNAREGGDISSTVSSESALGSGVSKAKSEDEDSGPCCQSQKSEMTLLDLYSGCGAMSTGLCLGANLSGVNLTAKWAVDLNKYACESLKLNHPETEVRNESAEDFLALLKEWEKFCHQFSLMGTRKIKTLKSKLTTKEEDELEEEMTKLPPGEFEVAKFVGICYGDPNNSHNRGLHFKVRWKGYGPSEDTWEPLDGLSKCQKKIKEFVRNGYQSHILPLPGDVDVICGGPPCQGISGFNRFRNAKKPLEDTKNRQMAVFIEIVRYLKPNYVLMENVVDILKFSKGFLGRYALSHLVSMNYQTRLGMMAAGCYGLPQYRMRVFLWGARRSQKLPQYPLPTHHAVVRGGTPNEFERNTVSHNDSVPGDLKEALLLGDAISDLPAITNFESCDEMSYGKPAKTAFQKYIRTRKHELVETSASGKKTSHKAILYDHRPLRLNTDDYQRVCRIPKMKGANFRHLPGLLIGEDNIVQRDESVEKELLASGKPLVPDYAITFVKGKSSKPFRRLWWDETVPTVVTRAEPHNQAILHPEQDRVLSIRENARLQGFPDYYKLCGPIKQRYIQVGNAVAVPVARALGYSLGLAAQGTGSYEPLLTLPSDFPQCLQRVSLESTESADVIDKQEAI